MFRRAARTNPAWTGTGDKLTKYFWDLPPNANFAEQKITSTRAGWVPGFSRSLSIAVGHCNRSKGQKDRHDGSWPHLPVCRLKLSVGEKSIVCKPPLGARGWYNMAPEQHTVKFPNVLYLIYLSYITFKYLSKLCYIFQLDFWHYPCLYVEDILMDFFHKQNNSF